MKSSPSPACSCFRGVPITWIPALSHTQWLPREDAGIQGYRGAEVQGCRGSGVQDAGMQEYRCVGMQVCRGLGMQECRNAGMQGLRGAGVQDASMQGFRDTGVQWFRNTGIQGFRGAGCRHAGCRDEGVQGLRGAGTHGGKPWLAVHFLSWYVLHFYRNMGHIIKQVWNLPTAFCSFLPSFFSSPQEDEHGWVNCLIVYSRPWLHVSSFLWVNDWAVISLKLLNSKSLLIWSLGTKVVNTLFGIFSSFRFKNSWRSWNLRFFFWIKDHNGWAISQKPRVFPFWSLGDNASGSICACD